VGITLESTAVKLIASGADIALVYPSDGTSFIFDGTAILKNAPHSENARRFLDFTVSYDVQKFLGEKYYRRPVRTDIPTEDSLLPLNQISLVDYDIRWAAQNREEILAIWSELFREGGSRK
jgi:iron(III) transport system substrate-binding protein